MKKMKYLILILCFSFLVGCSNEKDNAKPIATTTPLLIEVTQEETNQKLYLFGSIHAADESLYPLPNYVLNAYRNSDSIAVEFDLMEYEKDLSNQFQILANFTYEDSKTIKDVLDETTYQLGIEILKNAGLYYSVIDSYKPIIWESLIESISMQETGLDELYGIDKYFLNLAKEDHKKIIELESAEYQYNVLNSFTEEEQVYFLKEMIQNYEASKENTKQLYEQYKKGNKNDLENLLFEKTTNEYVDTYNHKLITIRNENMFTSLKEKLNSNKIIFCTVGLGHIIGENGLADLFSKEGYTITILK